MSNKRESAGAEGRGLIRKESQVSVHSWVGPNRKLEEKGAI